MSRDFIRQLKTLRYGEANPRPEWLESNRTLLLSQIKNTVSAEKNLSSFDSIWSRLSIFLPQYLVYNVIRPIAILLIVVLVGTSGWIATVDASYETLPGDWLYSAKRAAEKTQVVMASIVGNKNAETKLHMEFAKRRATETKKIVASVDPTKKALASQSLSDLKNELTNVNNGLDDIKNKPSSQTPGDVTRDVKQNTDKIKNVLQEVKESLQVGATNADKDLSKEVSSAKDMAKDTAVKAVEVMVAKHIEGDSGISKEDVKQAINASLQMAATEVGESKQNVAGVKTLVEAAKSEVGDLASELKKQNGDSVSSSTKELADKITIVSNQTVVAVLKSEAASVEVDKKISEARTLLNSGDLVKAIDKVKEVNEANKEAEKISDNALEKAQNVLPAVQVIKETSDSMATTSLKGVVVTVTTTPSSQSPAAAVITVMVSGTASTVKIISSTIDVANLLNIKK